MTTSSAPSSETGPSAFVPRRSALYMPGANDKALEKAKTLPTDAIIFDTEDTVAPDMKAAAREKVAAAVASGEYGNRELTIRVNSIDTEWFDRRPALRREAGPSGIVVPKINSAADVAAVESMIEAAGVPDHTRIWAMLETPAAMEAAVEIATSSERLAVLIMGTERPGQGAARRAGARTAPLLWGLAVRERSPVRRQGDPRRRLQRREEPRRVRGRVRAGRRDGLRRQDAHPPDPGRAVNEAFSPSADEVEYSTRVIEAFEAGLAEGKGVIKLDGRMIENLHVDNARRALAIADAIAARQ